MARIFEPAQERLRSEITNRTISRNVMEFRRDVFRGKQLDTTLELRGWVTVEGDKVNDFAEELGVLIDKYKI